MTPSFVPGPSTLSASLRLDFGLRLKSRGVGTVSEGRFDFGLGRSSSGGVVISDEVVENLGLPAPLRLCANPFRLRLGSD